MEIIDMEKKYTIYDNETNTIIFESDDLFKVNEFIDYNLEASELLHLHKENDIFIMYFMTYTIYMRM